jgi:hypothetical protein
LKDRIKPFSKVPTIGAHQTMYVVYHIINNVRISKRQGRGRRKERGG